MRLQTRRKPFRSGVAAVEFAFCFAFIMCPIMLGMWEVGRIVEIQGVAFNAAREAGRSISTCNEFLDPTGTVSGLSSPFTPNVANDTLGYLMYAEPQAFTSSSTGSWSPTTGTSGSWAATTANTIGGAGGKGYVYTDSKGEAFTISFLISNAYNNTTNAYSGSPNPNCKDPATPGSAMFSTNMNQLDQLQVQISIPYSRIALSPLGQFFSNSRVNAVITYASMSDQPYQPGGSLPSS